MIYPNLTVQRRYFSFRSFWLFKKTKYQNLNELIYTFDANDWAGIGK